MSSLRLQCGFIFKANTHTLILSGKPVQLEFRAEPCLLKHCALLSPAYAVPPPHCTSLGPGTREACILLSSGIMGWREEHSFPVVRPGSEPGVHLFLTQSLHNPVAGHVMEPWFLPAPADLPEFWGELNEKHKHREG